MRSTKPTGRDELLSTGERCRGTIFALVLVVMGFVVLYCPPSHSRVEFGPDGEVMRVTKEQAEASGPFSVMVVAGVALFGFVLNGFRLTKVMAGSVSAEAKDAGEAAKEYYENTGVPGDEEKVTVDNKQSPSATEPPVTHFERDDGRYAVYSLTAVPTSVLVDALSKWPENLRKPDDLSDFEFATRKTGKGNHPWTLKFKGSEPIIVSYGGQGKSGATVESGA